MISIRVKTDNREKTLAEFHKQCELGLAAIGETAERYAKKDCPVDTGRLRNSITYATTNIQGGANQSGGVKADPQEYAKRSDPAENTCYIGTNVEYAPEQEFNDHFHHLHGKAHFLRDAATTHGDEYRHIMEVTLKAMEG